MLNNEIGNLVLKTVGSILEVEVCDSSNMENTPEWDSLKKIDIIFAIEDLFQIQFEPADLESLNSIQSIVTSVQSKK